MTHQEAKEILAAYRPDVPREEAPEVEDALVLLEEDATLRAWFEAEQRFDEDFASALESIAVPENLLQNIVEQHQAELETDGVEAETEAPDDKVLVFPRRRLWYGAAAAAIVLSALGLVKYFMFPPAVVFPEGNFASVKKFCDDMAIYANSRFVLGESTKDYEVIRTWLADEGSPVYDKTPEMIVNLEGIGCQTFFWGENRVSLVCFRNHEDEIVHLFVVEKDVFDSLVPAEQLRAVQVRHELETGGWMTEEMLYLLVGSDAEVEIGGLLAES